MAVGKTTNSRDQHLWSLSRPQKSKTKNLDKLLKESENDEIHEPLAEETGDELCKAHFNTAMIKVVILPQPKC